MPHTVVQCLEAVIESVSQMGREKGGAILSGPPCSASMDRSYLMIVNSVAPTMPHHFTAIRLQPDLTRAMRAGGKDLDGAGDLYPEFLDGSVYRKREIIEYRFRCIRSHATFFGASCNLSAASAAGFQCYCLAPVNQKNTPCAPRQFREAWSDSLRAVETPALSRDSILRLGRECVTVLYMAMLDPAGATAVALNVPKQSDRRHASFRQGATEGSTASWIPCDGRISEFRIALATNIHGGNVLMAVQCQNDSVPLGAVAQSRGDGVCPGSSRRKPFGDTSSFTGKKPKGK